MLRSGRFADRLVTGHQALQQLIVDELVVDAVANRLLNVGEYGVLLFHRSIIYVVRPRRAAGRRGSRRYNRGRVGCFPWSTDSSMWYICVMTAKVLKEALQRVESWPVEAQEELAEIALEIDAGLKGGAYHATPQELEGIDRGLTASREGRFATSADVEAVLAKHRRA
jgi:hypothetical protein